MWLFASTVSELSGSFASTSSGADFDHAGFGVKTSCSLLTSKVASGESVQSVLKATYTEINLLKIKLCCCEIFFLTTFVFSSEVSVL